MVRPLQRQAEQEVAATKKELKPAITSIQLPTFSSSVSLTERLNFAQIGQFGQVTGPSNYLGLVKVAHRLRALIISLTEWLLRAELDQAGS